MVVLNEGLFPVYTTQDEIACEHGRLALIGHIAQAEIGPGRREKKRKKKKKKK